jgi:hypothetical protein
MISRIGGCLRHQGLVATAARPRIVSQVKGKKAGLEIRGCDENWGDARSSMKKDSDTDTGGGDDDSQSTRKSGESLAWRNPSLAQSAPRETRAVTGGQPRTETLISERSRVEGVCRVRG